MSPVAAPTGVTDCATDRARSPDDGRASSIAEMSAFAVSQLTGCSNKACLSLWVAVAHAAVLRYPSAVVLAEFRFHA